MLRILSKLLLVRDNQNIIDFTRPVFTSSFGQNSLGKCFDVYKNSSLGKLHFEVLSHRLSHKKIKTDRISYSRTLVI